MNKILVIDDERVILTSIKFLLEDKYKVYVSENHTDALEILKKEEIELVLLDLRLGKVSGLDVLKDILLINPNAKVIIMTAYSSFETSIDAIKLGAYYYISKPIKSDELLALLDKAQEIIDMSKEISNLKEESKSHIIGQSQKIKNILSTVDKVKDFNVNILITGESGTGKELIAKKIHYSSIRRNETFSVINCAAIPKDLLESELFGYKKGAFTGAYKDEIGIIRKTDKGTLFLDEIGEMDLQLQSKILRFLQEKEVSPIGSGETYNVDVRIVCATNRNLKEEIELGNFRKDLYYRINVVNIQLPALRERKCDIELLARYFMNKYNNKFNKKVRDISKNALKKLENYKFDGNIRELENIIERSIIMATSDILHENCINIISDVEDRQNYIEEIHDSEKNNTEILIDNIKAGEKIKNIEMKAIKLNLKYFDNNRKKTAEALGISERALRYKIKEYEL